MRRISYQYFNSFSAGLLVDVGVSVLTNFDHAVEYGQDFAIFGRYSVPPLLYPLAFDGIFSLVSLMFAYILTNTADAEVVANPELAKARQTIKQLRSELAVIEDHLTQAVARANTAEKRFTVAGDKVSAFSLRRSASESWL